MRGPLIGVIGTGTGSQEIDVVAAEVGREIARHAAVLVCGGLGGVMTAAARGAKEVGGYTVGILPGADTREANPYIDFAIATNMGQARNAIIVQTADVLIAIAGSYGTLSEIALGLKAGKPVITLCSQFALPGVPRAESPQQAVREAMTYVRDQSSPPLMV